MKKELNLSQLKRVNAGNTGVVISSAYAEAVARPRSAYSESARSPYAEVAGNVPASAYSEAARSAYAETAVARSAYAEAAVRPTRPILDW